MSKVLKKSLESGTSTTSEKEVFSFSSKEICEIIEICAKSGVDTFDFLDLKIKFKNIYAPTIEPITILPQDAEKAKTQAREANIVDNYKDKQQMLDQLLITDPVEYENLLRLGDLDETT